MRETPRPSQPHRVYRACRVEYCWKSSSIEISAMGGSGSASRARTNSILPRRSQWARVGQTFLRVDLENNTEARLSAHHPVIGGLGFFERKNLVHRGDAVELTEQKRVFRVDCGARVPTPHRSAFPEEVQRIDGQSADSADDHHGSIDTEAARDRLHGFGACDGGDDGLGAAHGLQRLGRIAPFAVDVVVRAQGPRQGFLAAPPIYRHRPEPLPGGELYAQVAKSADPMDRHQIARLRAAVPKGVEGGDAGTEERRGLERVQGLRYVRQGRGERQHVGGVAAVAGDAGDAVNVFAGEGVAPPAMATVAARTAEPAHPDPRAHVPTFHVRTQGVDHADYFMAGNAWIAEPRHVTFDGDGVTMADPAGVYADADLVTAALGQLAHLHAEAPARFRNNHCAHLQHGGLRFGQDQLYRCRGRADL